MILAVLVTNSRVFFWVLFANLLYPSVFKICDKLNQLSIHYLYNNSDSSNWQISKVFCLLWIIIGIGQFLRFIAFVLCVQFYSHNLVKPFGHRVHQGIAIGPILSLEVHKDWSYNSNWHEILAWRSICSIWRMCNVILLSLTWSLGVGNESGLPFHFNYQLGLSIFLPVIIQTIKFDS